MRELYDLIKSESEKTDISAEDMGALIVKSYHVEVYQNGVCLEQILNKDTARVYYLYNDLENAGFESGYDRLKTVVVTKNENRYVFLAYSQYPDRRDANCTAFINDHIYLTGKGSNAAALPSKTEHLYELAGSYTAVYVQKDNFQSLSG